MYFFTGGGSIFLIRPMRGSFELNFRMLCLNGILLFSGNVLSLTEKGMTERLTKIRMIWICKSIDRVDMTASHFYYFVATGSTWL